MRPWLLAPLLLLPALLCACSGDELFGDDLERARAAMLERKWPLAERLLERYLHDGQSPEKRFEAGLLLLDVLNSTHPQNRASLDQLESMLAEFSDNDERSAIILEKLGSTNERMRRFRDAEKAWSSYVGLSGLSAARMAQGFARLAAAQHAQRKFQASEESLGQCLALDISEQERLPCMLDMADLFISQERWPEVELICRQILDSGPGDAEKAQAGFMLGDALEQLGRNREAFAQFEEIGAIYPNPEVIQKRIAHSRAKIKRQPEK